MPIKDKIHSLGVDNKYIHLMLVSGPGGGKTVLLGTAPNALFITTDPEGTVSAFMNGSKAKEIEVESYTDIVDAYNYLKNGGIEEMGLEWILIDNTSETLQFARDECIKLSRARNKALDEFVMSQQDYQRSQNMLLKLVKQFNDLPVNVAWTAWQENVEDEEGNMFFAPAIHGQKGAVAQMVAGVMNVVGYIEVLEDDKGEEFRRVHFTHNGPFRGKDRYMALGKKRDNLTIPTLEKLIKTSVAKRAAESQTDTKKGAAPVRRRRSSTTTRSA